MGMNYELSPEQQQFVIEANEKSRLAREEREAKRIQRAEKLEGRKAEYAGIRGQLSEINQRLSDLNGKYNADRVELGDIAQDKIDAAGSSARRPSARPVRSTLLPVGGVGEVPRGLQVRDGTAPAGLRSP